MTRNSWVAFFNASNSFTDHALTKEWVEKNMCKLSEMFRRRTPSTVRVEGESPLGTNDAIHTHRTFSVYSDFWWCSTPKYLRQNCLKGRLGNSVKVIIREVPRSADYEYVWVSCILTCWLFLVLRRTYWQNEYEYNVFGLVKLAAPRPPSSSGSRGYSAVPYYVCAGSQL